MAAADVSLKLETGERIWFAHSRLRAFIFLIISAGFASLCWFAIRDEVVARYGLTAFALLFVLVGLVGIFWRMELDVDLVRRRVRQVRGLWPMTRTTLRQLDDADGVWLRVDYCSNGTKSQQKVPWWLVSLRFPDEKEGTRLFATRNEVEGYRRWEHYARRLALPAVDATSGREDRRSWRSLDDTVVDASEGPGPIPVQPSGSQARLLATGGRREILLPPLGFSGGLVMLSLFGCAFMALGGGALLANVGLIDVRFQGSEGARLLVPPVFILFGMGIIWLSIKSSFSSPVLGVDGNLLYIEKLAFGRRFGRETVPLREIESVAVEGDVRARKRDGGYIRVGGVAMGRRRYRERAPEVVLRSDRRILRFGASNTDAEKAWLADVCRFAIHHGCLP